MEWLLVGLFLSAVSYFINSGERAKSKQDALDIQHDQQEFNAEQAELAYDRQTEFWLEHQSPEAMFNQYRKLGASESASLMSALGVSPSVSQSPMASSGIASGLGAGVNTISDLFTSITSGFNQYLQGQKAREETKWVGSVNEANIKATLSQLELNWVKFGLDKNTFDYISKPLAEMSLDKSRQDIEESKARVDEIGAKILQIEQSIKESKQNVNESIARVDFINAQTTTEGYKQENLAADTGLKESQTDLVASQTTGQDIENSLQLLSLGLSQSLGFDCRLSWQTQAANALQVISNGITTSWFDFKKSVDKTYDGLLTGMEYQDLAHRGVDHVQKFMTNPFFPHYNAFNKGKNHFSDSYDKWLQKRGKHFKSLENWINSNTRYGM